MNHIIFLSTVFFISCSYGFENIVDTSLSTAEQGEINGRISAFYSEPRVNGIMDRALPKFDVVQKIPIDPNSDLRGRTFDRDPLVTSTGRKMSPRFRQARCEHLFKQKFPYLECDHPAGSWAKAERNDLVEDLSESWISPQDLVQQLDALPVKGQISQPVWSGDYWRMRWGLISYRYAEKKYYAEYKKAIEAYQQPGEWLSIAGHLSPEEMAKAVVRWSPSEKYDLLVGDENMTLTREQKMEGSRSLGADGNVESWFGLCHGWAPASIFVPVPKSAVTTIGAKGTEITWYPEDIRAIATLAWAKGHFPTSFVGGRCEQKDVTRLKNGRIAQQECFDTNPATLHLSLGNMIGLKKTPIIMDAAFDYQVWNQPILSYEFQYFNPLSPRQKGKDWHQYAISYDDKFKKKDRFQQPLTRGRRTGENRYDDSRIDKIVGVTATIVYLAGINAVYSPNPEPNSTVRVTYSYDLEFEDKNGDLVPTGGEWHENSHPDFLWIPKKGSVATHFTDHIALKVDLKHEPDAGTTSTAQSASRWGYPLCQVLEQVVQQSSGSSTYRCGL